MAKIDLQAFCIDDEFESSILASYGVKIIDRTNAPWDVTFEGSVEGLVSMADAWWGIDIREHVEE